MNLHSSQKSSFAGFGQHEPDRAVLLNVKQAAARVGLSVSTLNKMRLDGSGSRFVKLGRRVLYDARDLDEWISKHKRSHTSETA